MKKLVPIAIIGSLIVIVLLQKGTQTFLKTLKKSFEEERELNLLAKKYGNLY